jgi:hypothetical protein
VFYLILACVLRFAAGISLRGEVNRIVTRLITRGDVVLRLQGSALYDLKPDRYVASDQIDSYLEPDERSGITFPSGGAARKPKKRKSERGASCIFLAT